MMYGKIDKKIALDYAIRDEEQKEGRIECGYKVEGKDELYWNYLENSAFEDFVSKMSEEHNNQYKNGDGGELDPKKGRYGLVPPKMASFGSSSRFIYRNSKDIEGFEFEKQLDTEVGGKANLDGYLKCGETDIFVEAKCREIYDSHKKDGISNVYKKVYDNIKEHLDGFGYDDCGIAIHNCREDDKHFKCTFKMGDKEIGHFDVKQLICHFLGISANILKNDGNTDIKFIYLIFNPNKNTCFDDSHISSFKKKIEKDYNSTLDEIKMFSDDEKLCKINKLFDVIMNFQSKLLHKQKKDYTFEFILADQANYRSYIFAE